MKIEPNLDPVQISMNPAQQPPRPENVKPQDEFINSIDLLKAELMETDEEVRPEVVQRGKELLASEFYPPLETVVKIANLLGDHIKLDED
ncbi:MAG: hypothetical protein ACFHW5_06695 [Verrucomicrobiota bacterium]